MVSRPKTRHTPRLLRAASSALDRSSLPPALSRYYAICYVRASSFDCGRPRDDVCCRAAAAASISGDKVQVARGDGDGPRSRERKREGERPAKCASPIRGVAVIGPE